MLLKKAEKTLAYGKVGIFGFQGSGKTFTAIAIAKGISKIIGNKKIAFYDTETGSDWFVEEMEAEGYEFYQLKTRSFKDLTDYIKECEDNKIGVLIIDSLTHVWRELCESYKIKLNRKKLQFQDWDLIKGKGGWQDYADLFVNSKVHIIACGRAGYEYDNLVDDEGNKELLKTGTKMKAEGEFGFEPHLVIEMERIPVDKDKMLSETDVKKRRIMKVRPGSEDIHRAYVLKDRSDYLDGKQFDDPTFDDFRPHFEKLNLGGVHLGVDTSRTSQELFDKEGRPEWKKQQEEKQIALEEMKGYVELAFPGSTAAEKRAKGRLCTFVFGTTSNTAIEAKPVDEVKRGSLRIKLILENRDNINILLSDAGGALIEFKEEPAALELGA